jgi:subtilisin
MMKNNRGEPYKKNIGNLKVANLKIFIIILVLLFGIILVSSEGADNKVSSEVYSSLQKNDSVEVVIKLKIVSNETIAKLNDSDIGKEDIYKNYVQTNVSAEELSELKKNSNVEQISEAHVIRVFLQDSVPLINATRAWSVQISGINLTGSGQTVCIIDTGTNFSHPDLIGKNKSCIIDCFNKDCVENCSSIDDNGHGTHVAGIVAASGGIFGVAINVSLISVKIMDATGRGSGNDLDLSRAIDYCANNNVSVISMSLGTDTQYLSDCSGNMSSWTDSINNATTKNISIVAAAGNSGSKTGISSPACIGNVSAIGATDKSDDIASYSNRNSLVQLFAPGGGVGGSGSCSATTKDPDRICSTYKNGAYISMSGTSMATPHVAGAIAIIKQFLNLTGQSKTPLQIKSIFNSTGKQIYDSGTGLNFSRISVYDAIVSLDNPSNVSLIYPTNNIVNSTTSQIFSCNATDNIKVKNLTLQIWGYNQVLYYDYTNQTSGNFISLSANLTNILKGNYKWNCLAYNENNAFSYAASNFSFYSGNISVVLEIPGNNSYTNVNSSSLNCTAQTINTYRLSNVTLFIWNSSNSLIYNITRNISGVYNTTSFLYNLSQEGSYKWNCKAFNNASQMDIGSSNYSITYDITAPNITLISPDDSSSYTSNSQLINFVYNISDNYNIANCSLIVNEAISLTNSSIANSFNQNFSQTFSPGSYNWKISCIDYSGNLANSSQRSFVVSAPTVSSSESSSGGGGGTPTKTSQVYNISYQQTLSGYTKELSKNDKIRFTFYDINAGMHTITVNEIKTFVNLTIESKPINILLGVGQSVKLSLVSPYYYDLYIKLEGIENNKAILTIQTINESIEKPGSIKKDNNQTSQIQVFESQDMILESKIEKINNTFIVLIIIAVVFLVIICLYLFKREKKIKEEVKEEYREKFKKHVRPRKNNKKKNE